MFRFISISLLIISSLLSSCTEDVKSKQNKTGETKTEETKIKTIPATLENIKTLEAELFASKSTKLDLPKAKQLTRMYLEYSDKNPKDSLAPEFLYKAADISMNLNIPKVTIAIYNKLINNYPDYVNIPTATFLMGYVYENQLNDLENARKHYQQFLKNYPDSEFADDAEVSLKNLGKTPEELIKEYELNDKDK